MKLLTKDLEEKLKEYPLGSQDGKLGNSKVIAKFFNPTEVGTWYIIEGKLSELESIQLPKGKYFKRDILGNEYFAEVVNAYGQTVAKRNIIDEEIK